jgi:hypothetical protein
MRGAPPVERGFSPLDEELALGPGAFSPRLTEGLVRLGAHLPFGLAVETLAFFTGVEIGVETARTVTEAAGAALVHLEEEAVATLEREHPRPSPGPREQVVSVDGAFVSLLHREWAEVKTLAVGALKRTPGTEGEWEVHTTELSYCSHLADAQTFGRLTEGEFHRRGTEHAEVVCAVTDGAEWIQGFLAEHCPHAIPILDFPHAVEHLSAAAHATFGSGTLAGTSWLEERRKELREGSPAQVLTALRELPLVEAADPTGAAKVRDEVLGYLDKRQAHLTYAEFLAQGWPIGSGCVESANKLVVEARLKGSGMHWARGNVDPMLALRTTLRSGRWAEAWPLLWQEVRRAHAATRGAKRAMRIPPPEPTPAPPARPPRLTQPKLEPKGQIVNGKPTANHPWKRGSIIHPRLAATASA